MELDYENLRGGIGKVFDQYVEAQNSRVQQAPPMPAPLPLQRQVVKGAGGGKGRDEDDEDEEEFDEDQEEEELEVSFETRLVEFVLRPVSLKFLGPLLCFFLSSGPNLHQPFPGIATSRPIHTTFPSLPNPNPSSSPPTLLLVVPASSTSSPSRPRPTT